MKRVYEVDVSLQLCKLLSITVCKILLIQEALKSIYIVNVAPEDAQERPGILENLMFPTDLNIPMPSEN